MPELDFAHLLSVGAYFAASVAAVAIGKLSRDVWASRKGHKLAHALAVEDNAAVAIEQSTFVVATVMGLLGSIVVASESWYAQAADFAITAALVLAALTLAEKATARLILPGIDLDDQVVTHANVAVATARAASVLATALVVRAALGHESAIEERIAWVFIGQGALVAMTRLYQRLTSYDDVAELKRRNLAAALPLAGIQVAVGLVIEAALRGEGAGWAADLSSVGLDLALSAVLIYVLRVLGDWLLLHHSTFAEEIARDRNIGAGFVEGSSYIAGAFAVAFFLN